MTFKPLLLALSLALPAAGAQAREQQLPNLVPLPASNIRIAQNDERTKPALRFSVGVANRGDHAFDLVGVPDNLPQNPRETDLAAHQCVQWAAPRVCLRREPVGRFVWHPAHGHWHVADFALYELWSLDAAGEPDEVAATGGKISFCLLDYDEDDPNRDPVYLLPHPVYTLCELGNQGISPGWKDVYEHYLPGQQILLGGVPDGDYSIVVTTDPTLKIHETTKQDNVSVAKIKLSGGGTVVTPL